MLSLIQDLPTYGFHQKSVNYPPLVIYTNTLMLPRVLLMGLTEPSSILLMVQEPLLDIWDMIMLRSLDSLPNMLKLGLLLH